MSSKVIPKIQEYSLQPTRGASFGATGLETAKVLSHAREWARMQREVGNVSPRLPTHLPTYILEAHQRFLRTSRLQSPSSVETLDRVGASVYPLDGHRKGVAKWIFLLFCVCLGHSNILKQGYTQDSRIFPPADPRREFRGYRPRNRKSIIACA